MSGLPPSAKLMRHHALRSLMLTLQSVMQLANVYFPTLEMVWGIDTVLTLGQPAKA